MKKVVPISAGRHSSRRSAAMRRAAGAKGKALIVSAGVVGAALINVAVLLGLAAGGDSAPAAPPATGATTSTGKYWIVSRPGEDGRKEFLFDIAERSLGDGDRYTEIFDLNEGRTQPDGDRMTSPDHIDPGWVLLLPADAGGPGVHDGAPPVSAPAATGTAQQQPGGSPTAVPPSAGTDAPSHEREMITALYVATGLTLFGVMVVVPIGARLSRRGRADSGARAGMAASAPARRPRRAAPKIRATPLRPPPERPTLPMPRVVDWDEPSVAVPVPARAADVRPGTADPVVPAAADAGGEAAADKRVDDESPTGFPSGAGTPPGLVPPGSRGLPRVQRVILIPAWQPIATLSAPPRQDDTSEDLVGGTARRERQATVTGPVSR